MEIDFTGITQEPKITDETGRRSFEKPPDLAHFILNCCRTTVSDHPATKQPGKEYRDDVDHLDQRV